MLEDRIPVAKAALRSLQRKRLPRHQIDGVERMEAILQFHPVRADVLHGRRTHRARNQRHVFQTRPALGERPRHQAVPVFTSARFDQPAFFGLLQQPSSSDLDLQHQRLDVTRDHQVAATTQHKNRCFRRWRYPPGEGPPSLEIGLMADTDEALCTGSNAKTVERLQGHVVLD
jgi:hypothetical protein